MTSPNIAIAITGAQGCGKTRHAHGLASLLALHGYDVLVVEEGSEVRSLSRPGVAQPRITITTELPACPSA